MIPKELFWLFESSFSAVVSFSRLTARMLRQSDFNLPGENDLLHENPSATKVVAASRL